MKKEMIIAIVIGFLLGLVITFGIYRLRVAKNRRSSTAMPSPSAAVTPVAESLISIHNPEEGTIQESKTLTVTGSTIPDSYVVLFVNEIEYIRQSDEAGNFSFDVELADGSNLLTVNVLTDDGQVISKERTVIVTNVYNAPPVESATPSASPSVRPTATPKATATPRPAATVRPSATPRPTVAP